MTPAAELGMPAEDAASICLRSQAHLDLDTFAEDKEDREVQLSEESTSQREGEDALAARREGQGHGQGLGQLGRCISWPSAMHGTGGQAGMHTPSCSYKYV